MLNNSVTVTNSNPIAVQEVQDEQSKQVALERLGTNIGGYIGRTTNNALSAVPGLSWAMDRINTHFSSEDSRNVFSLERIRDLQSTLHSICLQFDITTTPDFEARVQQAKSQREKVEFYKTEIETQLKNILQLLHTSEQLQLPSEPETSGFPPTDQLLPPSSSLKHSEENQSSHSISVSASSSTSTDESDPKLDTLHAELRVLFDILEAVCFNDFSRLEEKHWIKLEALLKEPKTESHADASSRVQMSDTQESVNSNAIEVIA